MQLIQNFIPRLSQTVLMANRIGDTSSFAQRSVGLVTKKSPDYTMHSKK